MNLVQLFETLIFQYNYLSHKYNLYNIDKINKLFV